MISMAISDTIKRGALRAPHRSLLRATGVIQSESDWDKPFIAVANSFVQIIPGHAHLDVVGKKVRAAIRAGGGVPFEFNTIGVDDGIAMGHGGMKYSLASREIIADSIETMLRAHCFDGVVCIPNCDKIVPGMMMGAARVNIPTVFVSGGPMAAGRDPVTGRALDLASVFEAVGQLSKNSITESELDQVERHACGFHHRPLRSQIPKQDRQSAPRRIRLLQGPDHIGIEHLSALDRFSQSPAGHGLRLQMQQSRARAERLEDGRDAPCPVDIFHVMQT